MNYSFSDQSNPFNWNNILQERGAYHPEFDYFMVDYYDYDNDEHIRLPFLRQQQVFQVVNILDRAYQMGASISNIRVLPERFLDEPYANPEIIEEAFTAGVKDAKYLRASTREVLFDSRYEAIADAFKTRSLRL